MLSARSWLCLSPSRPASCPLPGVSARSTAYADVTRAWCRAYGHPAAGAAGQGVPCTAQHCAGCGSSATDHCIRRVPVLCALAQQCWLATTESRCSSVGHWSLHTQQACACLQPRPGWALQLGDHQAPALARRQGPPLLRGSCTTWKCLPRSAALWGSPHPARWCWRSLHKPSCTVEPARTRPTRPWVCPASAGGRAASEACGLAVPGLSSLTCKSTMRVCCAAGAAARAAE